MALLPPSLSSSAPAPRGAPSASSTSSPSPSRGEDVKQGDSDLIPTGFGTGGSRSVPVGGSAVMVNCVKMIDQGKAMAAALLGAADQDVSFDGGSGESRLQLIRLAGQIPIRSQGLQRGEQELAALLRMH